MPDPELVLLWLRSLAYAGGLGPPRGLLERELGWLLRDYRPRARA